MKPRFRITSLLVAFSMMPILASCGSSSDSGEYATEISAVKASIEKQRNAMGTFRAAPLNGGVAVLSSREWAYWVKDGHVYAANGLAMSASPSLPTSPTGIDLSSIQAAVR